MYSLVPCLVALLFAGVISAAPSELTDAFQNLKDAVAKDDSALVKKLAGETVTLARQTIATPDPADATELETLKKTKAFAAEVQSYAEYALYAAALKAEPAVTIDLLSYLEQLSPKSKYMGEGYAAYFAALQKAGSGAKIPDIAEAALKNHPDQEDLLLVMIDHALGVHKQTALAGSYAERLLAAMSRHPKPEAMSAADWERKRSLALSRSYWIAGLAHGEKGEYFQCNKDFRAALPYIKDNPQMAAAAYFYLGVSNYHLGRAAMNRAQILEAAKFSEQCAAIPGAYQSQAWTNAHLMKAEAERMVARK